MIQRIFWAVFGACLSVLLIALFGILSVVYQSFFQEQVTSLHSQTIMLADLLDVDPNLPLDQLHPSNTRISLIKANGEILYDSLENLNEMDNHLTRPEIIQAHDQGEGFSLRPSKTLDQDTYNVAIRLKNGDFLRLSRLHSSFLNLLRRSLGPSSFFILISLLVSLWMARRAAKNIVAPINAIDPNHPKKNVPYEQLEPLLDKLEENRKQIVNQLEDLERKNQEFALISQHMDEGMILLGAQNKVLFANQAALKLFPSIDQVALENLPPLLKALIELAKENKRASTALQQRGSYHLEAHCIENKSQFLGVLILILDVTEREEIKKRRQEFTANVTHELKTPLQTIVSASELLKNQMVAPADQAIFGQYIYTEATRMAKMINDIIHLSRLDSFESSQEEMVHVSSMVQKAIDLKRPIANLRQIKIETDIEDMSSKANPQLLEDIISCLLENAILYNKDQGWIRVSLKKQDQTFVLKVCDGGIGIDPSLHERIFERFYTVDSSHNHQGTGLGLAIVKNSVDLMEGTIQIESSINCGSCFTINLPYKEVFEEDLLEN